LNISAYTRFSQCFYTPFGVRCFGTFDAADDLVLSLENCFYTPFGVRCFGTRRWK